MPAPLLAQLRNYLPIGRRSAIVTLQLLTTFHLVTTDVAEIRLCAGFSMLPTLSHQGDFVLISPLPLRFHESGLQRAARGHSGGGGWFRSRNARAEDDDTSWGIKRGDIIIATSPTDPSKTVCKRVIGLEGDVVQVDPTRARRRTSKPTWEQVDAQHREDLVHRQQQQQREDTTVLVPVFPSAPPPASLIPSRRRSDTDHVRIPRGHVWLAGDNLSNSTDSRAYGPVPIALLKGKVLARVWPNPKWITNETRYID